MFDVTAFATPEGIFSLLTLTLMEIVLGIDNLIFIAIVSAKLATKKEQGKARTIGLAIALMFRIFLLFSISWIIGLKDPIFSISIVAITGRDLILFVGGLFLIIKTTKEILEKINQRHEAVAHDKSKTALTLQSAIVQITFLDIIFSFDSILTAVGLIRNVAIMIAAVIISMIVMLVFSAKVADFINRHPTVKMLALTFLVAIGVLLVLESLHIEIDKGYVYSGLVFALIVELLNMAYRSKAHKQTTNN
jgi:predicted tellurium resistance membrane protein TerC